jgi:hypothetical protein
MVGHERREQLENPVGQRNDRAAVQEYSALSIEDVWAESLISHGGLHALAGCNSSGENLTRGVWSRAAILSPVRAAVKRFSRSGVQGGGFSVQCGCDVGAGFRGYGFSVRRSEF